MRSKRPSPIYGPREEASCLCPRGRQPAHTLPVGFVLSPLAIPANHQQGGAYGSSKAAFNSLARHLAVEEPDIAAVAISPGRVDTGMQKELREQGAAVMAEKDYTGFKSAFEEGKLNKPEWPGAVIAQLAVGTQPELSGKYFRYVYPHL